MGLLWPFTNTNFELLFFIHLTKRYYSHSQFIIILCIMSKNDNKNLQNIQRIDRCAKEIILHCTQAALYEFTMDENKWKNLETMGPLFVYRREEYPSYALVIANRQSLTDYVEPIVDTLNLKYDPPYILIHRIDGTIRGIWIYGEDECKRIFETMVALRDKVKQRTEDETQGHTKKINIMKEIQQHSETFISSEQIINKAPPAPIQSKSSNFGTLKHHGLNAKIPPHSEQIQKKEEKNVIPGAGNKHGAIQHTVPLVTKLLNISPSSSTHPTNTNVSVGIPNKNKNLPLVTKILNISPSPSSSTRPANATVEIPNKNKTPVKAMESTKEMKSVQNLNFSLSKHQEGENAAAISKVIHTGTNVDVKINPKTFDKSSKGTFVVDEANRPANTIASGQLVILRKIVLDLVKRTDPFANELTDFSEHVVLYKFDVEQNKWIVTDTQGPLVIFKRHDYPYNSMLIFDMKNNVDFVLPLLKNVKLEYRRPYIFFKGEMNDSIHGIWFQSQDECTRIYQKFAKIMNTGDNEEGSNEETG